MDWLKSTRSCISMTKVPTNISLIAALCVGQLQIDAAMKVKIQHLVQRPVAMRKHVEKVLLELDIPVEEANKIDTTLKWCSTYQFNVEIVSQPADECVIEFATKFTYDSVITLFKDKDIYYLITNRSKFFKYFTVKRRFRRYLFVKLFTTLDLSMKTDVYLNGSSKMLTSLKT